MPTYEYICEDCTSHFEVHATIEAKTKGLDITCEKCGSKKIKQLFHGFSMLTNREKSGQSRCGNGGSCCG